MEVIYTDAEGKELGELQSYYLDVDIGDSNDFELTVRNDTLLESDCRILVYGSECGGILKRIKTDTASQDIIFGGHTWRGMLKKRAIRPLLGQDYRIVSGNAGTIINGFLSEYKLSELFVCDSTACSISSYQFERYCTLLDGINSMLKIQSKRINIYYGIDGKVHLSIADIVDHSDRIEFSQDGNVQIILQRNNDVVNHLICLGKGDLKNREVVDLYMDRDGNVSQTQTQFGVHEIAETYDYGSSNNLTADGTKKLKEQEREKAQLEVKDIDVELGDIVGARDYKSGVCIKREITKKIIRVTNGTETTEYKVGE